VEDEVTALFVVLRFSCSSAAGGGSVAAALTAAFQVFYTLLCILTIFCLSGDCACTVALHGRHRRARLSTHRTGIDDALANNEACEYGSCKQQCVVGRNKYDVETLRERVSSDSGIGEKYQREENVLDTCQ